MKTLLLYIVVILFFFSCKKENFPKETQRGLNTFGCYINGAPFVPSSTLGGNITPVEAYFAEKTNQLYKAGFLSISAHDLTYNSPFEGSIEIQKLEVNGPGEYFLTHVFSCNQQYYCDAGGYNNSSRTKTFYIETGKLIITKLDTTAKIISGRFFFTAKDSLNNKIEVTKGVFDISYTY